MYISSAQMDLAAFQGLEPTQQQQGIGSLEAFHTVTPRSVYLFASVHDLIVMWYTNTGQMS